MMKKLLCCLTVFMAGTVMSLAQDPVISILGGSTSVGWSGDLDMATTDGVIYTYENLVVTVPETDAGVKFRKDHDWAVNWGANAFPAGTGTLNGPNIPVPDGVYDVTFNYNTGQYAFTPAGAEFDEISIVAGETEVLMVTGDGITYTADYVTFSEESSVAFMVDGEEGGWGGPDFPSGTAVEGSAVTVPANSYNITYNNDTKAYSFDFVRVSMIGTGAVDWDTDVHLDTDDGVNYWIMDYTIADGVLKFRMNEGWDVNWGSEDFPSGTGTTNGTDIPTQAGVYNITLNRLTGEYNFEDVTAGTENFAATAVTVYPNPAQNQWTFTAAAGIDSVALFDISGKVVFINSFSSAEATVNAFGLAAGMYFAKVTAGKSVSTVKVIKN